MEQQRFKVVAKTFSKVAKGEVFEPADWPKPKNFFIHQPAFSTSTALAALRVEKAHCGWRAYKEGGFSDTSIFPPDEAGRVVGKMCSLSKPKPKPKPKKRS